MNLEAWYNIIVIVAFIFTSKPHATPYLRTSFNKQKLDSYQIEEGGVGLDSSQHFRA